MTILTRPAARASALRFLALLVGGMLLESCSAPVPRPTGRARTYEDAKDLFKRGRFDRALDYTNELATASPPNAYTERARVLRAVIFSGHINAYLDLADAYRQGMEATKNPRFQGEFSRLRHDYQMYGSKLALGLGETANQLTADATLSKELLLEAPYPTAEGPIDVAQLHRVREGGWLETEEQDAAALDALRKGIDDALAAAVGGDRSKARVALLAGPVKLSGVDFGLFLGKQLLKGAAYFDRKHLREPQKLRLLTDAADRAAKAVTAQLKERPNPDKEKEVKKLQDEIKATAKNI